MWLLGENGLRQVLRYIKARLTGIATEAFVNSSVQNMKANRVTYDAYGNQFPTRAALLSASTVYYQGRAYIPKAHDYCIVTSDEGAPNPFTNGQTRYEHDGARWIYDMGINDRPNTAAENAALASGITYALVAETIAHHAATDNPHNVVAAQVKFTDGQSFQEKYNSGQLTGAPGKDGNPGKDGERGEDGIGTPGRDGAPGAAATVTVGTVTTGAAGSAASVTNAGTANAAVLNFVIPKGGTGATGATGAKGNTGSTGATGAKGTSFWGTTINVSNISQISGMAVGDYIVNTSAATRTILGRSTAPGGIVKSTSATAGADEGSLAGSTETALAYKTGTTSQPPPDYPNPDVVVTLDFIPSAIFASYDYGSSSSNATPDWTVGPGRVIAGVITLETGLQGFRLKRRTSTSGTTYNIDYIVFK